MGKRGPHRGVKAMYSHFTAEPRHYQRERVAQELVQLIASVHARLKEHVLDLEEDEYVDGEAVIEALNDLTDAVRLVEELVR